MKNKEEKEIKGQDNISSKASILGTFEGECADASITNKNGLDITKEVWDTVFASEEYKDAIELGHYIGFLGHPEDPNCMDFEHACIVMKEGHIEDDGKVYGKFDLIDTPVGKIVKSFQDAGVQFGISVRGAGDIIDNSVDPETFVFRGFDLVSFPAYPDAIPTFSEVAASSDAETQKKYKTICAAVKNNLESLNTCDAIDVIQPQFAKQSEEYQLLEDRRKELSGCESEDTDEDIDIRDDQIQGLTTLYMDSVSKIKNLEEENSELKSQLSRNNVLSSRRIKAIERIVSNQKLVFDRTAKEKILANKKIMKDKLYQAQVKTKTLRTANLKYKQRVEAADDSIHQKDAIISSLKTKLSETVESNTSLKQKTSNLDVKVKKLKDEITASQKLIQEYQDAYGNMYANALGVHLDNVTINSSTTVSELKESISSAASERRKSSINSTSEDIADTVTPDTESEIVTL